MKRILTVLAILLALAGAAGAQSDPSPVEDAPTGAPNLAAGFVAEIMIPACHAQISFDSPATLELVLDFLQGNTTPKEFHDSAERLYPNGGAAADRILKSCGLADDHGA